MTELYCPTPRDTLALGERLGRAAMPGTVVALIGDLGAGKTVMARGIGAGLGVDSNVCSPSFVLMQMHEGGRLPLWHADLYRLSDPDELREIGLEEQLEGDGLVLVEWADRFADWLPADHLEVRLEDQGEGRRVRIAATGPRHAELVAALVR